MNEKQAGGDIIGRLAGLASRPFVGAAKSDAIQQGVVGGITRHINEPIERGLRASGVHKAISKAYEVGMTPIPGTPRLVHPVMPDVAQRQAYGNWKADDAVHALANHPESAFIGPALAAASPALAVVPGTGFAYHGAKTLAGKALGIKKMAAFADEMEKIAKASALRAYANHAALNTGQAVRDIRYFYDHPDADRVSDKGSAKHVASSITSRVPSLASNSYYAAIPPQLHHTKEELEAMEGSMKDWFLHGYNPWDHKDPSTKEKKANGDMLQYFADHPDKLKAKQERDRKKHKEKTAAVSPYQQKTAAKHRTLWHGSPTGGLDTLEPQLDPRTKKKALFATPSREHALVHALLENRARSEIGWRTNKGAFEGGAAISPTDPLSEGYLYELYTRLGKKSKGLEGSSGTVLIDRPVKPKAVHKVTLEEAKKLGWKFETYDPIARDDEIKNLNEQIRKAKEDDEEDTKMWAQRFMGLDKSKIAAYSAFADELEKIAELQT